MTAEQEKAKATLVDALDYLRHSVVLAEKTGTPKLAVLSCNPDGSGKVIAKFDCAEFFADLATVLGVGEQTQEGKLKAQAVAFLHTNNIRTLEQDQ